MTEDQHERSSVKRVVYTAVFGGYDQIAPVTPSEGCDFVCFTDRISTIAKGWTARLIDGSAEPPSVLNRRIKMLPHQFLSEYSESLYVDGHVVIKRDPSPLFRQYLDRNLLAIPPHEDRNCAYEEADHCQAAGIVAADAVRRQMSEYSSEGFPRGYGLSENGIILRRHNEPQVIRLMEAWWSEYLGKCRRDQLSLPYLSWKQNIRITALEEGPRRTSKYFTLKPHSNMATTPLRRLTWQLRAFKHRSMAHRACHALYDLLRQVAARSR